MACRFESGHRHQNEKRYFPYRFFVSLNYPRSFAVKTNAILLNILKTRRIIATCRLRFKAKTCLRTILPKLKAALKRLLKCCFNLSLMKFFVAVIIAAAYAVLRRAAVKPAARIFEPSVIKRVGNLHDAFRRPVLNVFDN